MGAQHGRMHDIAIMSFHTGENYPQPGIALEQVCTGEQPGFTGDVRIAFAPR